MDHVLSSARQKAVLSIAKEQAQVRQEAEKALAELGAAMTELCALYTSAAGLSGDWVFAQNAVGEIVLRPVGKVEPQQEAAKVIDGDAGSPAR